MTTQDEFSIEVLIKGLEKIVSADQKTAKWRKSLSDVSAELAKIEKTYDRIDQGIGKINNEQGSQRSLQGIAGQLRGGGANAVLQNAKVDGAVNRAKAEFRQEWAAVNNELLKAIRGTVKAFETAQTQSFIGKNQRKLSDDPRLAKQQIEAQRYNVAQADRAYQANGTQTNAKALKSAENSLNTLLQQQTKRNNLVAIETRELKKQDTLKRQLLAAEVTGTKADQLAIQAKIKQSEAELEIARAGDKRSKTARKLLNETKQLTEEKEKELKAVKDAAKAENLRRKRAKETAEAIRKATPEYKQQERAVKSLRSIDDARSKIQRDYTTAVRTNNELAQAQLRAANNKLKIDRARLLNGNRENEITDRLHAVQKRLTQTVDERKQAIKDSAAEERKALRDAERASSLRKKRAKETADAIRKATPEYKQQERAVKGISTAESTRAKLQRAYVVAVGTGNELSQAELRAKNNLLKIDHALLRNGGQRNETVDRLVQVQKKLNAELKEQRKFIRETEEAERRRSRNTESAELKRLKRARETRKAVMAVHPGLQRQKDITSKLQALDQKRGVLQRQLATALHSGNKLEEYKLQHKINQVRIDRILLQNNNLDNATSLKLRDVQAQITDKIEKRKRALREAGEVERQNLRAAQKRQSTQDFINNKDGVRSQAVQAGRVAALDKIAGDGGAFLFSLQTQILGNYLILNKLFDLVRFGAQFVVELDRTFYNLQAITATTATGMADLRNTLIEVSTQTKFTAVEVAQAAQIMGQAGFSVAEIKDSIGSAALLATATGTELSAAVDIMTSTISVFNLQASESERIANTFTAAINGSKLSLDKLTLGFQYAGNIASQLNVNFTELTGVLGAMANAGIRTGSTLGTGLRQLLVAFSAPSEKLKKRLDLLGISLQQIDVRAYGIVGVMQNLRDAGFSSADAMETLEVRAGSAFTALQNQLGTVNLLQQSFVLSSAAAKANETQMQSLGNQIDRLKSNIGVLIKNMSGPLVNILKTTVRGLNDMAEALNRNSRELEIVGTILEGVVVALGIGKIFVLLRGINRMFQPLNKLFNLFRKNKKVVEQVNDTFAGFGRTMTKFALGGALVGGAVGISGVASAMEDLNEASEQAEATLEKTEDRVTQINETMEALDKQINKLATASGRLDKSQSALTLVGLELQEQFGKQGLTLVEVAENTQEYIDKLVDLRQKMAEAKVEALQLSQAQRSALISLQLQSAATQLGNLSNTKTAASASADYGFFGNFVNSTLGGTGTYGGGLEALFNQGDRDFAEKIIAPHLKAIQGLQDEIVGKTQKELEADPNFKVRIRGKLDEFITNIDAKIKEYQSAGDTDAAQVLKNFKKNAANVSETISNVAANIINDKVSEIQTAVAELQATTTYNKGFTAALEKLQLQAQGLSEGVLKSLSPEEATTLAKQLSGVFNATYDQLDALKAFALSNGVSEDSYKGLTNTKLGLDVTSGIKKKVEILNEIILKGLEENAELLEQEQRNTIATLKKEAQNPHTNIGRLKQIASELRKIFQEIADANIKAFEQSLKTGDDAPYFARYNERKEIIGLNEKGQRRLRNFSNIENSNVDKEIQSITNMTDGILNQFDKVSKTIILLADNLTAYNRGLKEALKANRLPENRTQAFLSASNLSSLKDKYTPQFLRKVEEDLEKQKTDRVKADIDSVDANKLLVEQNLFNIQKNKADLQEQINVDQAEYNRLLEFTDELSKANASTIKKRLDEYKEKYDEQAKKEIKTQQTLKELERERYELKLEYNARTGQTEFADDYSVGERFQLGAQQFLKDQGYFASEEVQFFRELPGIFETVTGSFQTMLTDVVTGAQSIGDAFKGMARTVIKALLDIAAKKAAMAIFDQVISVVSGSIGSAGAPAGSNVNPLLRQFGPKNNGGYIRKLAAGGYMSTRDSVPAMLRPGEFVMRNSAVEAIGRDNLEAMNAMGARRVSQGVRVAPQTPKEPDMVNVYVVAPDQKPQMGAKDIVAVITDDIARGGTTKKLVKSVAMGQV